MPIEEGPGGGGGKEPGLFLSVPCLFGKSLLVMEGVVPGREPQGGRKSQL